MLTIGIEYLTGYAVATEFTDRDSPEWPPHPARVFMAMAAAYFECGEAPEERDALLWLEKQQAQPDILASAADARDAATHYVPVNDSLNDPRATLPMLRKRQPRTFPRVWLHDPVVYLHWPDAQVTTDLLSAINALCGKVARIGHSSSLVQMWASDKVPPESAMHERWRADGEAGGKALRMMTAGSLDELRQRFRAQEREEYLRLVAQYESAKGKEKKQIKQQLDEKFDSVCPEPVRPVFSVRARYHAQKPMQDIARGLWHDQLIFFALEPTDDSAYLRLDVRATLQITDVFRKALISTYGQQVPEFVSGHKPDQSPTELPHCAFLTLPFIGRRHADGHLMGLAIAYPKALPEAQRRDLALHGASIQKLTLGRLGCWRLKSGANLGDSLTLRSRTWCGGPEGATHWATATPIVFDGHPKEKDRAKYLEEVSRMIRTACTRIGLPEPESVVPSHVGYFAGAPTSQEFPRLMRKDGSQRRHLHATIVFKQPVSGPILLGAGRFRGYGLLRPKLGDQP